MNRDDVIRLAREADDGFQNNDGDLPDAIVGLESIERFAALIAAAEREVCAKVCDDLEREAYELFPDGPGPKNCAAAIRARGAA